jgi:hypothetical protein
MALLLALLAPLVLLHQYSTNARSSQVGHEQHGRCNKVFLPLPLQKRNGAFIPFSCKGMGLPTPLVKLKE